MSCQVLGISRAGYYKNQQPNPSQREIADQQLLPLVENIFWEHRRRYGARRLAKELTARGHHCGPGRVAKLMKRIGLMAIQPRSFLPKTTQSRHKLGYSPNLLLDGPRPTNVNQLWVGDITYVPLAARKFSYLAILMDFFSRRVVGWQLEDHMTEALILQVLRQAIAARQPPPKLIHHSDRGGQYAGKLYRQTLARAAMRQSMSRPDNCYDNAVMESCFGTIKTELETAVYDNIMAARKEIGDYLVYYNVQRRHSSLDYLSPADFEASPCANPLARNEL